MSTTDTTNPATFRALLWPARSTVAAALGVDAATLEALVAASLGIAPATED